MATGEVEAKEEDAEKGVGAARGAVAVAEVMGVDAGVVEVKDAGEVAAARDEAGDVATAVGVVRRTTDRGVRIDPERSEQGHHVMSKKTARHPGTHHTLSRRERQIMDVVYQRGSASVADVMTQLSGEPAYSTVRAQLRVLEAKGHLRHEEHGPRYVYVPAVSRRAARQSMLRYLVETFFDGSVGQVLTTLLGTGTVRLSDAELDEIERLIAKTRKSGGP
jgi:predicted transcriptional regulator